MLAGIESHTSKDTWRHPTRDMSAYFGQLTAWGYAASNVEQIVINQETASAVPDGVDRKALGIPRAFSFVLGNSSRGVAVTRTRNRP